MSRTCSCCCSYFIYCLKSVSVTFKVCTYSVSLSLLSLRSLFWLHVCAVSSAFYYNAITTFYVFSYSVRVSLYEPPILLVVDTFKVAIASISRFACLSCWVVFEI